MKKKNERKAVMYIRAATDTIPQEDHCVDGKGMFRVTDDNEEEVTKKKEDDGIPF